MIVTATVLRATLTRGMTLLTYREIIREPYPESVQPNGGTIQSRAGAPEDAGPPAIASASVPAPAGLVPRKALGIARYDVALLACGGRASSALGPRLAAMFRRAGFTAAVVSADAGGAPTLPVAPDTSILDDARACIVVVPEKEPIDGPWLWWLLGRGEIKTRRQAILPIARRDGNRGPGDFSPALPPPLARLPYLGRARAVGEQQDSLWVAPAGSVLESREADSFEFWLHER